MPWHLVNVRWNVLVKIMHSYKSVRLKILTQLKVFGCHCLAPRGSLWLFWCCMIQEASSWRTSPGQTAEEAFKKRRHVFVCLLFSRQEKEPLRVIPLKEVHKVQECKQRWAAPCAGVTRTACAGWWVCCKMAFSVFVSFSTSYSCDTLDLSKPSD